MRFSYSAALLVAGLMFLAPAVRADMITLTISDGTTSYSATGDAASGVTLGNFTLDGVSFRGASAFTSNSGGESVNFGTSLASGPGGETAGKTISYTITDSSVPGSYTSFVRVVLSPKPLSLVPPRPPVRSMVPVILPALLCRTIMRMGQMVLLQRSRVLVTPLR